jgi:membrane-associated PAP2 superfamily phosphatase
VTVPHGLPRSRWRHDLAVTLLAALLLLAWDATGADLWVSRAVRDGAGFAWRDAWLTRHLLHDGGRWAAAAVLAALVWRALRGVPGDALDVRRRWATLGMVLLSLLVVPSFKRASATSCPWDLAEFGGSARLVSHWAWGVADGGPGHCFPSGHAVAAFCFLALYFAWRDVRPAVARRWLAAVMIAGALFGAAQVLRGAHFVSHVAWTAWICWTLAASADLLSRRRRRPRAATLPSARSCNRA